jgi:F0F1-type ATP synthase epsilon subunit
VTVADEQGSVQRFEITGGLIEVKRNRIILLADGVRQS